jgi:hypothetical protein
MLTEGLSIEIETHDPQLDFELMGSPAALEEGVRYILPDGSSLVWQSGPLRKAFGVPQVLHFILTYGKDVSAGVIANYVFSKINGRSTALRIDRKEVQLDQGQITRVLTEHIEKRE